MKHEYRMINIFEESTRNLEFLLNQKASEGWSVVALNSAHVILERYVTEPSPSETHEVYDKHLGRLPQPHVDVPLVEDDVFRLNIKSNSEQLILDFLVRHLEVKQFLVLVTRRLGRVCPYVYLLNRDYLRQAAVTLEKESQVRVTIYPMTGPLYVENVGPLNYEPNVVDTLRIEGRT